MTYDEYLQNLMGDLNPQGNMLTRGPVQMPDVSGIQAALANVQAVNQGYQAPVMSDLNAVRAAKEKEIAVREAEKSPELLRNNIMSMLSSGGTEGLLGGSSGAWDWGNPAVGGVSTTTPSGLLGKLADVYGVGVGTIMNALGINQQDPSKASVSDLSPTSWGGEGSGNGGFSYGNTSDSGYASDAGYSGGGGWSSSDYGGGWSGY